MEAPRRGCGRNVDRKPGRGRGGDAVEQGGLRGPRGGGAEQQLQVLAARGEEPGGQAGQRPPRVLGGGRVWVQVAYDGQGGLNIEVVGVP